MECNKGFVVLFIAIVGKKPEHLIRNLDVTIDAKLFYREKGLSDYDRTFRLKMVVSKGRLCFGHKDLDFDQGCFRLRVIPMRGYLAAL